MARFETDGLDELMSDMRTLEVSMTGEIADAMLMAGAEAVKTAWRRSAESHGHRYTGSMIENIGYPRQPKTVGDVRSIDIYPQGKDSRGYSNAAKAFVLHYGTKRMPASRWIDDADAECSQTVVPAMRAKMIEELNKRGM